MVGLSITTIYLATDALTPPSRKTVELHSSGSLIQTDLKPRKDADGFEWPEAATHKDEVLLGTLKGGTHPQKVKIGDNIFVRKKVLEGDSQAIMMEALTNQLYEAASLKAERCRYYPARGGKAAVIASAFTRQLKSSRQNTAPTAMMLCRFMEDLKPAYSFTPDVKKAITENFALDAIFANYDVGGTNGGGSSNDRVPRGNVGWVGKDIIRVDNGGSLAADGLGDWKPTTYKCKDRLYNRMISWTPVPFQLWDFQRTSEIYNTLSKEDIVKQVKSLKSKEKDILAAVDNFDDKIGKDRVKATLKSRLACAARIAEKMPELFDGRFVKVKTFDREMPQQVCDNVHLLCADLIKEATDVSHLPAAMRLHQLASDSAHQ